MELIHADSTMKELRFIDNFTKFDASVSIDGEIDDNSWMLSMPVECYSEFPVNIGDHIFIEHTEWGGPVEKIKHNSASRTVSIYGMCWRGLLLRGVIRPNDGETHLKVEASDGNDAIRTILGDRMSDIFSVSEEACPIDYSYSFRYATLLDGITDSLNKFGCCLNIVFSGEKAVLSAVPVIDYSENFEFSSDMNGEMISEKGCLGGCNHILALGSGEMLERQVIDLWCLPDGSITDDPSAEGIPSESELRTYLYDYAAAESEDDLKTYAKRKLKEYSQESLLEFTPEGDLFDIALGDTVGARDKITGLAQKLCVEGKILTIDSSGVSLRHSMKAI